VAAPPSLLEESSCQLGAVHTWHKADLSDVRYSVALGWKADFEQAASKMLDL
jgi:hypothetical protein